MGVEHKRPLYAFVAVASLCAFLMIGAVIRADSPGGIFNSPVPIAGGSVSPPAVTDELPDLPIAREVELPEEIVAASSATSAVVATAAVKNQPSATETVNDDGSPAKSAPVKSSPVKGTQGPGKGSSQGPGKGSTAPDKGAQAPDKGTAPQPTPPPASDKATKKAERDAKKAAKKAERSAKKAAKKAERAVRKAAKKAAKKADRAVGKAVKKAAKGKSAHRGKGKGKGKRR